MLNQSRWHHEHTWPPEPGNVQQARRFVSDLLRAHGLRRVEVETLMVVSELATNAVVHARTTFSVGVAYANCTLTVTVHDRSEVMLRPTDSGSLAPGGRGLFIVGQCSSEWGAELDEDRRGKAVWARIPVTAGAREACPGSDSGNGARSQDPPALTRRVGSERHVGDRPGSGYVGPMDPIGRNNVRVSGRPTGRPLVFAHGFGCDQHMWRLVAPHFEDRFKVVLFDHVGAGESDISAYDVDRYSSLDGYAADVNEICQELDLEDVVFVGHSVSAMIGMLAALQDPGRYAQLVMVGPSPRYIDDDSYVGGFSREDIDGLLESLDSNYLGWSSAMAPVIMGNPDRPELGEELTASFCRTDPDIARRFAAVTFLSDNRADLGRVDVPTLVLQCSQDAIAPVEVGQYVHDAIPGSTMVMLDAVGHCPNLSAPAETTSAIAAFVNS